MEDICYAFLSRGTCPNHHSHHSCPLAHSFAHLVNLDHWLSFDLPDHPANDFCVAFLAYKYCAHPNFKWYSFPSGPVVRFGSAFDAQQVLLEYKKLYHPRPLMTTGGFVTEGGGGSPKKAAAGWMSSAQYKRQSSDSLDHWDSEVVSSCGGSSSEIESNGSCVFAVSSSGSNFVASTSRGDHPSILPSPPRTPLLTGPATTSVGFARLGPKHRSDSTNGFAAHPKSSFAATSPASSSTPPTDDSSVSGNPCLGDKLVNTKKVLESLRQIAQHHGSTQGVCSCCCPLHGGNSHPHPYYGWAVLSHLWGIRPDHFSASVVQCLAQKPILEQEQLLLSFAAKELTARLGDQQALSDRLYSWMHPQEPLQPQVCLLHLAGVCPSVHSHPGATHLSNSLGWQTLHQRWNLSPSDFDLMVLNRLCVKALPEQDKILLSFAETNLSVIGHAISLSDYLANVIQNMESFEAHEKQFVEQQQYHQGHDHTARFYRLR